MTLSSPDRLTRIRLFRDAERLPVDNMAMDEALYMRSLCPVVRFYGWSCPAVSLGYFCSWAESRVRHGELFSYVRRWTGGGTVEHGNSDATYSISLPADCPWGRWRAPMLYERVHLTLAVALQECGIETDAFGPAGPVRDSACFQHPVAQDLVLSGRKVAGAAIRRSVRGVLLQGSIQGIAVPPHLPDVFARLLAGDVEEWNPGTDLDDDIASLVESRYGRVQWTRRK
ncbi:MAG: lipoate--protein ligase family protein [Verrucomicrobiae bacterium]|nr:lipoate--protein ligase family protein [Verrucomicrobiae bacterium]